MLEKTDWSEQIKRYSDELRQLHSKSDLPTPAPILEPVPTPILAPAPEPSPKPVPESVPEESTRDNRSAPPFGDVADGTAQEITSNDLAVENATQQAEETDVGTLVVRLNSARGTIPIVGATVTVFRPTVDGARLYYMGETDENGETPTWTLPTLDRELSLEPGVVVPYVNYAVQANAVGFAAVLNEGVSVFGGVKTVQRIAMLPLPEPMETVDDTLLITRPENPENELNGGDV